MRKAQKRGDGSMTPSPSSQEEARELTVALDRVREELRVTMLDQPITGERRTYNDGFASGLAHAIHRIDSINDPTRPTPDLGDALADSIAIGLASEPGFAEVRVRFKTLADADELHSLITGIALRAALDKKD
jgi:hypothetical protein